MPKELKKHSYLYDELREQERARKQKKADRFIGRLTIVAVVAIIAIIILAIIDLYTKHAY